MVIKSAVILAAGKGKRLQPLTKSRSKAMLPIVGKPMLERVMAPLISIGISDFTLVISPDDELIIKYLSEPNRIGVRINYVFQESPNGTAQALQAAASHLHQEFILSACDNLVPSAHIRQLTNKWIEDQPLNGILSLLVVNKEKSSSAALVKMKNNHIVRIVEKPSPDTFISEISSIPLYCFSPRILNYLKDVSLSQRGEYEIQDAIQMLITKDGLVSGLFTHTRLTVTCPGDLLYVNMRYLNRYKHQINKIPDDHVSNSRFLSPIYIEDESILGKNCSIGPNVYIESGSIIEDFVTIIDSVILRGAVIKQGS